MSDSGKVKLAHTRRAAFVYIRQSSPQQVENNRESTARQYALVERACELGIERHHVRGRTSYLASTAGGRHSQQGRSR